jgi:hypothetical protein
VSVVNLLVDTGELSDIVAEEGAGRWMVRTQNSTYEIERDTVGAWTVRRVKGSALPTPRQGTDGDWKDAEAVHQWGDGMLIVWSGVQCTFTSRIAGVTPLARSHSTP